MTGAATDTGAVARARRLLARRGGWVEAVADGDVLHFLFNA